VGSVHVHEFMSLDGGFTPEMEETIRAVTSRCQGVLLGRTTFETLSLAATKSYDNGVVYLLLRPQG
jgi:dihydrofolate reductase